MSQEFQLAFKNLYPGVLDNNSKGRGKGTIFICYPCILEF